LKPVKALVQLPDFGLILVHGVHAVQAEPLIMPQIWVVLQILRVPHQKM
jgi:hypothetical protein